MPEPEPSICEPGGGGLLLPLFGDSEQDWPNGVRVVLYFLGLLWSFLGVGIVADIFMSAIEVITSKTRTVTLDGGQNMTVVVWNETVSNLTLMALGSSAPEILLSVIEILGNDYYSGELGPSTIVGSAAFNLFCITAVCVVAIPAPDTRNVAETGVFAITAFSSVFAYLWLIVILQWNSPDIVSVSEALITFLFFPALVAVAFAADKGFFKRRGNKPVMPEEHLVGVGQGGHHVRAHEAAALIKDARREGKDKRTIAALLSAKLFKPSRAVYRINATRLLSGAPRLRAKRVDEVIKSQREETRTYATALRFSAPAYSVLEGAGQVQVVVERVNGDAPQSVAYHTEGVTATEGEDYEAANGVIEFAVGETSKTITITIIDDDIYEDDETFRVVLASPQPAVALPEPCVVTIVNDDLPGSLSLSEAEYRVTESQGQLEVSVRRVFGTTERVTVKYRTQDGSAKAPLDYQAAEGELVFEHGEDEKSFTVQLVDDTKYEKDETFFVELFEPTSSVGEAAVGPISRATVLIENDDSMQDLLDTVQDLLNINEDAYKVSTSTWKQQFADALTVGTDDEDAEPSAAQKAAHYIALPWKLLFACIPPTDLAGGWLCFVVALVFIGGVTAFVGDLAALLGCTLDLKDSVTAITFVALGTSLPDTFASKAAAQCDDHADASIGNVTGSNSVNVFLGLGLPWLIGALYWAGQGATPEWVGKYPKIARDNPDGGFAVPAGDLSFSVAVFSTCACVCIATLVWRRGKYGGELGGPKQSQQRTAGFFVSLWLVYVLASSLKTYGHI